MPAQGVPLQSADGRVRWTGRLVAVAAILMAWTPADRLRDAWALARAVAVEMYPTRRRPGRTFEGFKAAWLGQSDALVGVVARTLRGAVRRLAGRRWTLGEWVVMGVDGTRVECPRTAANEAAFGCAGRNKTTPQQLVTAVFHVATGLVWAWRRGRGDAAERKHLREMLGELPERTLLLADAGFTGYDLLASLGTAGHDFIVRVGSGIHLLENLGYAVKEHRGTVYLWPQACRAKRPLELRLVRVGSGAREMCLLTSVLERSRLTDAAVAELYRRRWGVEVLWRSLKQTLGGRKMRSVSPAAAAKELDWTLLGLWMLGAMTVKALGRREREPSRWSPARALRTVRRWMDRRWARRPAGGLKAELRRAVKDRYVRHGPKRARDWPHKKNQRPPGTPKLRMARPAERLAAKALLP